MRELSEEEQAKVAQYRSLLYQTQSGTDPVTGTPQSELVPTPLYRAYQEARQAYEAAELEYRTRRAAAATTTDKQVVLDFSLNASQYRLPVQAALRNWIGGGYKYEVENMLDYLGQVTGRPAAAPDPPDPPTG